MRIKVCHLTTVHKQNDNRIFYKECISLKEEGYDVTLICAGAISEIKQGIKIIGFNKESKRLKRMIKTSFFDIIKICKKVDANVYHFHDPELIFAGLYLKLIGKKVIYDIHENNPASILSKPYIKYQMLRKIISKIFDVFEKFSVKFFDALITARPDITNRFKHRKVVTLRNFPKLPNLKKIKSLNIKGKKPVVIFVGGMTKIRGIEILLEVFQILEEAELWLLGPITEKDLHEKILRATNKNDNIKYFGCVEPNEVFNYINEADIGIITFLPVPNHIKTLATKPFEYMACGKPIIMSNFEYWKNFFKDSALYVDPFNVSDIKKAILYLIKNSDIAKEIGEKNKQLIKNEYNWEKESKKLKLLYIDLIKGNQ